MCDSYFIECERLEDFSSSVTVASLLACPVFPCAFCSVDGQIISTQRCQCTTFCTYDTTNHSHTVCTKKKNSYISEFVRMYAIRTRTYRSPYRFAVHFVYEMMNFKEKFRFEKLCILYVRMSTNVVRTYKFRKVRNFFPVHTKYGVRMVHVVKILYTSG